jgi:L-ascorbate metabolism protein UlaG (beta-lactamase superfamily)
MPEIVARNDVPIGGNMSEIQITWLGHGTFAIRTAEGRTLLVDPWVEGNPSCPAEAKKSLRPDALLVTHGHYDHAGEAVALAKKHTPEVVAIYETAHWLESKGVSKARAMNKGGSQDVLGVRVTMVHADHSCGILDDGKLVYGGEAAGYVLRFPKGPTLYFSGDTNVFGDMRLIGELYRPDVACLPIGDLYTMGPREAAVACRMLGVRRVIPMHWGTFPALTGTPDALRAETRDLASFEVVALAPGESTSLR